MSAAPPNQKYTPPGCDACPERCLCAPFQALSPGRPARPRSQMSHSRVRCTRTLAFGPPPPARASSRGWDRRTFWPPGTGLWVSPPGQNIHNGKHKKTRESVPRSRCAANCKGSTSQFLCCCDISKITDIIRESTDVSLILFLCCRAGHSALENRRPGNGEFCLCESSLRKDPQTGNGWHLVQMNE